MFVKETFTKRLHNLYEKEDGKFKKIFTEMDYFVCVIDDEQKIGMDKSIALMHWLLGFDLANVIVLFSCKCIKFICSNKETNILKKVFDEEISKFINTATGIKIEYIEVAKTEKCHEEICKSTLSEMEMAQKYETVGLFKNQTYDSMLTKIWYKSINRSKLKKIEINDRIGEVLCIKDDEEIKHITRAAFLSSMAIYRYMDVVDHLVKLNSENNNPIRNIDIVVMIGTEICQGKLFRHEKKNDISLCFFPILQSGGNYKLKLNSGTDMNNFKEDVIIISFGMRYKSYCSVIIRTLIVMPEENVDLKQNYYVLVLAHEFLIGKMKDGIELNKLYQQTVGYIKSQKLSLVQYLTNNFGSSIGLELEETSLCINSQCEAVAKENMVFNVNIGLLSVSSSESSRNCPSTYSLWIGDTVKVEKHRSIILSNFPKSENIFIRENRF